MFDDPREDLSPAERRAFDALPREWAPRPELEERTVAALQSHGVLPTPISAAPSLRRSHTVRRFWMPVAAAAAVAIFTTGLMVGQYVGSRSTVLAFSLGRASADDAARHVQQAGSLYVATLAALTQAVDSVSPAQRDSARMVALRVLSRAAEEMALLAPDDPLAAAVLRVQNQRSPGDRAAPSREVVWY